MRSPIEPVDPRPVAVICVMHDSTSHLAGFVDAIADSDILDELRLIFVDSGSTDGSVELAARLAPTSDVCRLPANRGYAAGINAGIAHAVQTGSATSYLVANPDVRPRPNCIRTLVQALDTEFVGRSVRRSVGITTPVLLDEQGERQDTLGQFPTVRTTWTAGLIGNRFADRLGLPVDVLSAARHYRRPRTVGWATGGLLAISAACAAQVGPWPEHLFMYEEEVEFCRRAESAGFTTLFAPVAVAVREVGHDRPDPWRYALMRANRAATVPARQRPGVVAGLLLADLLRSRRASARAGLWALTRRATPRQVLDRYLPAVDVECVPPDAPPSLAELVHPGAAAGFPKPQAVRTAAD